MMDLDYKGFVERTESTKDDITYVKKVRWNKVNETQNSDMVPGFPINKKIPYAYFPSHLNAAAMSPSC